MPVNFRNDALIAPYLIPLLILSGLGLWLRTIDAQTGRLQAGWINFSLGFVLLAAYLIARSLKKINLPLISGYIIAGILAGPYVSGFLTTDMVERLRMVDDLALSFIALTAGGTLHLSVIRNRRNAIAWNVWLHLVIIFAFVMFFVLMSGRFFVFTQSLSAVELLAFAILLGVIAVARSPSSAIAIINECDASGPFTETVLGVTIVIDVVIIIFFTVALSASQILLAGKLGWEVQALAALSAEMIIAIMAGAVLGKGIAWYIERVGHDLVLCLLFLAFAVSKTSQGLTLFMEYRYQVSLHLEPLLICMSAGFTVQNFSKAGSAFMESLESCATPIFALFFSLAGAAINFEALGQCWPFAVCLAGTRAAALSTASRLSGMITHDPPRHNRNAWMAYLTQAGVSIGLATLVQRQLPEIGRYLTTVVLAVISINQIIGPILFKIALKRVGETRQ